MRAALPLGSAFNYRVVTGDADSFRWSASPGNIAGNRTTISHPVSNGDPTLALFATHNLNPLGGPGTFNPNITAMANGPTPWDIMNLSGAAFTPGTFYNVTARARGSTDFYHPTTAANVVTNSTVLSHPLLDGNPGATFQVTPFWGGNANQHHIGVYYDGAAWRIFNQDPRHHARGAGFLRQPRLSARLRRLSAPRPAPRRARRPRSPRRG